MKTASVLSVNQLHCKLGEVGTRIEVLNMTNTAVKSRGYSKSRVQAITTACDVFLAATAQDAAEYEEDEDL